jgi:predicted amidophosphoribosyltransferase
MIKSENTSSPSLLKRIDELLIDHHSYLQADDEIYYLGEYTNGKLADFSPMNRRILNYKKELKRKGSSDWVYKGRAIKEVADMFRLSILQTIKFPERITKALLVPIPPHAVRDDPEHDDRNLQMLHYFMPNGKIHELVLQKISREPSHKSKKRRNPKELEGNYFINPPAINIEFSEIWLFDDVLRDGTHFRAAHSILSRSYPHVKIVGFFVARSVHASEPLMTIDTPPF